MKPSVLLLIFTLLLSACSRHEADKKAASEAAQSFLVACRAQDWDAALEHVFSDSSMRAAIVDGEVRSDLAEVCEAVAEPLAVDNFRFSEEEPERHVTLSVELAEGEQRFLILVKKRGDGPYGVATIQVAP